MLNKKKLLIVIVGSVLFLFFVSWLFLTKREIINNIAIKLAILDTQKLTFETDYIDQAKDKLRKEYAGQIQMLKQEEEALSKEVDKYNDSIDKLKPEELKKWSERIDQQQIELRQKQFELQEKLIAAENMETQEIIEYFADKVAMVSEKNDLGLVLFKDVTFYNSRKVPDITNLVIELSIEYE